MRSILRMVLTEHFGEIDALEVTAMTVEYKLQPICSQCEH